MLLSQLLPLLFLACNPDEPAESAGDTDTAAARDTALYELVVSPYLQSVSDEEAWVLWITDEGEESRVTWGPTEAMENTARGEVETEGGLGYVHSVRLEGLIPGAEFYYQAHTGGTASPIASFRAAPMKGEDADLLLIAMSDMQRDDNNPDKFEEIINDGIIPFLEGAGEGGSDAISMLIVPGDLVENGWDYRDWWDQFFTPAAALLARTPLYPVPGNHEADSPLFFRYFRLPENGSPDYEEHWWTEDRGRLRVIGLDSNVPYRGDPQRAWLAGVLADTCTDPDIDFVFAQLHHPYLSELWIPGEEDFSGEVVSMLETFTTDCGKPSVHLFGHTHGYSRGQSRDHRHLMVNVASAGGAIDRWGGDAVDYEEFSVSQDEWGFVVIEVQGQAADPAFTIRRVSRGNGDVPRDNELRDQVTVRRYDAPPAAPEALGPTGEVAGAVVLVAGAFSDPDGDLQGAAHWEVSGSCEEFSAPVVSEWVQHENWWFGEDLQAGDDLTDVAVEGLTSGAYCWRVRYRDRGLSWSDWSAPMAFSVP